MGGDYENQFELVSGLCECSSSHTNDDWINLLTNTFVFLIRLHTHNYYNSNPNTQILQHRWHLASPALWRSLNYWDPSWGNLWSTMTRISSQETESCKPGQRLKGFTVSKGGIFLPAHSKHISPHSLPQNQLLLLLLHGHTVHSQS